MKWGNAIYQIPWKRSVKCAALLLLILTLASIMLMNLYTRHPPAMKQKIKYVHVPAPEIPSTTTPTTPEIPSTTTPESLTTSTIRPRIWPRTKPEFPPLYKYPSCKINEAFIPEELCDYLWEPARRPDKMRDTYMILLNYFDEMATKHGWTYFMAFGTLLGSWRHHDIIPWDHDVDLWVDIEDRFDIVDKIEEQMRFVPKQMTVHRIHLHDEKYIAYTQHARLLGWYRMPSIDMFFFRRNATHIMKSDYPEDRWEGSYIYRNEDVFPLHRRPFGRLMLQAPKDPLKMLVREYGVTSTCDPFLQERGGLRCERFSPYWAFVHRRWMKAIGKMKESLVLDGRVLHVKMVDEMKANLPVDPYSLDAERFHPRFHRGVVRPWS